MKRRTIIITALLATAPAVCLFAYFWYTSDGPKLTVHSKGPLDVRLWGIRPDEGDAIYDPNGGKIQDTLGVIRYWGQIWDKDHQRMDFIFELPRDKPIRLMGIPRIRIAGEKAPSRGRVSKDLFDYDGRRLLWFGAALPRTFRRSTLRGWWVSNAKLDAVDITVRYYYGSMDSPGFVLQGPFEPNSTVSGPDKIFEFSFEESPDRRGERDVKITLRGPENWNEREPIIIYDASGNRRSVITREILADSRRGRIEFIVKRMSLERISAVGFAQCPREIVFKNVNLNVAGRRRRAYPACYDEIAERLQTTLTGEELIRYGFRSAGEALKVIDIVRDFHLKDAAAAVSRALSDGDIEQLSPEDLTDEQTSRLRQTLSRWLRAIDPRIRAFAVEIGLLCKWHEFVDPALELLERPVRHDYQSTRDAQSRAAAALGRHADELSDEQIRRVADLLAGESQPGVTSALKKLIMRLKIDKHVETLRKQTD